MAKELPKGGRMSKRQKIYFRVAKGCLMPADNYAASLLRERGYNMHDLLAAELTKPRNPKFNRLVHRIGQLVVTNVNEFSGMDAHAAIKRLQWEGNIACEEVGVSMRSAWEQISAAILKIPGMSVIESALKVVGAMLPNRAMLAMRQPRSLANESMDEGEYQQAARGICRTIAERYWQDMDEDQIAEMAESFIGEA